MSKIVGSKNTVFAKPHPWSYKLQEKAIRKISKFMRVVSARDAYWALKSMDAAIGVNSTSGIELSVLKKPIVYLGRMSRRPYLNSKVGAVGVIAKSDKKMYDILDSYNFNIPNKAYDEYLNKVYPSPFKPAFIRICDFFEGLTIYWPVSKNLGTAT